MKAMAPGVWRLKELPLPTINVHLVGDVPVDAGRTWDRRRILAEIDGREFKRFAAALSA